MATYNTVLQKILDDMYTISSTPSETTATILEYMSKAYERLRLSYPPAESIVTTLTDALTINVPLTTGQHYKLLTTSGVGNSRTITIRNPIEGQRYYFKIIQDGTGSRTVTWAAYDASNNSSSIKWQGGSAPTLTTTLNKSDLITFYYSNGEYFGWSNLNF